MQAVNEQTFSREVLNAPRMTLVHFWAPWCGLCRFIVPTLESFAATWEPELRLVGVNADENFKLANFYRLTNLPTLFLFDRGVLVHRFDHFRSREELQRTLDAVMLDVVPTSA